MQKVQISAGDHIRTHSMSDKEIERLLRSLPRVKAAPHLETRLSASIARRGKHVPNMLGSLPMVPAHEDFDARLLHAIQDRRRRVAPPLAGGATVTRPVWGRWLTGAVVIGGLLFGFRTIDHGLPHSSAAAPVVSTTSQTAAAPVPGVPGQTADVPMTSKGAALSRATTHVVAMVSNVAVTITTSANTSDAEPTVADHRTRAPYTRHAGSSARRAEALPKITVAVTSVPTSLPAVPRTLPASHAHRVIENAQPRLEPPATGSDIKDNDDSEVPH